MKVLLVNPPILDFTAYDFWLRPYGLSRVAGWMRHCCELSIFDFLVCSRRDEWGRGRLIGRHIPKPAPLRDIPRKFRRFGRPREEFRDFLQNRQFDSILIQTVMTYWYPGVKEVIEDARELQPSAKVVLGGVYSTLCPEHAISLGADLVIKGSNLDPLWNLLSIKPVRGAPYWDWIKGNAGAIKITEGCPFRCTYCSAPLLWPGYVPRPLEDCLDELKELIRMDVRNIAFYDDALLFEAEQVLVPFLENAIRSGHRLSFHTPNALNARFMDESLAHLMVRAGFKTFFFGLESCDPSWQRSTGGKVYAEEFAAAVRHLRAAGAGFIGAYIIVGHPDSKSRDSEESIRFAHQCGARVILSEFSPVPGTVDGIKSQAWADMSEPLSHNKTAFTTRRLGPDCLNNLKALTRELNSRLQFGSAPAIFD
jgi:radical SAM superfamily enzyme YgiQ (UPF0313 family)